VDPGTGAKGPGGLIALLAARSLSVRPAPGAREVVREADFDLHPGDFVLLQGESGAGKTTLLRALGRLNPHWHGDLRYRDRSLRRWEGPAFHRRVAFLHQVPVMFEGTVADNVHAACRWLNASPPADPSAWLASVRLAPTLWDEPASGLSVGEKQRLALLRALLGRPEILLLDEVTASLDPTSARAVEDRVAAFHRNGGTVVWIRHKDRVPGEGGRIWTLAGGVLREES